MKRLKNKRILSLIIETSLSELTLGLSSIKKEIKLCSNMFKVAPSSIVPKTIDSQKSNFLTLLPFCQIMAFNNPIQNIIAFVAFHLRESL